MDIKNQFLDVIEFVDTAPVKQLVHKFNRPGNEIKQGSRLIVRNGQVAVFVCRGQIADIIYPGNCKLKTGNLPILSTLGAFPTLFNSPIKSDLYFINTTQYINLPWETPNPIIKRDSEMGIVRITATGKFSFRIKNPMVFMNELFGARTINMTGDIILYLRSFVAESIAQCIGELDEPVIDLATRYMSLSDSITDYVNRKTSDIGIEVPQATISSIGLPPEVERLIDEQSGINLAAQNMDDFIQYQTARAIRDAAKQPSGLAGIGASYAVGRQIGNTMSGEFNSTTNKRTAKRQKNPEPVSEPVDEQKKQSPSLLEKLKTYKEMLDSEMITQEEYDELKSRALREGTL